MLYFRPVKTLYRYVLIHEPNFLHSVIKVFDVLISIVKGFMYYVLILKKPLCDLKKILYVLCVYFLNKALPILWGHVVIKRECTAR